MKGPQIMFFCEIPVIDSYFILGVILKFMSNFGNWGKSQRFSWVREIHHSLLLVSNKILATEFKSFLFFNSKKIRFKLGSQNLHAFPNYIVKVNINHSPIHTFGQFVITTRNLYYCGGFFAMDTKIAAICHILQRFFKPP